MPRKKFRLWLLGLAVFLLSASASSSQDPISLESLLKEAKAFTVEVSADHRGRIGALDQPVLLFDTDLAFGFALSGGLPDPAAFKLYQVTALDFVNPEKPSQGRLVDNAFEKICPLEAEGEEESPDDLCLELSEGSLSREFAALLSRPLEPGSRYVVVIEGAVPLEGAAAAKRKAVTLKGGFDTLGKKAEQQLGRGPLTIGLDYLVLKSDLPLSDDPSRLELYIVSRNLTGKEILTPVAIDRVTYGQAEQADPFGSIKQINIYPSPKRTFSLGREYTFRVTGKDGKSLTSLLGPQFKLKQPKDYVREGTQMSDDDLRYEVKLFSQVADDTAPILSAEVALSPPERSVGNRWWYTPSLEADVGSGNSESKNVIKVLPVAFQNFKPTKPESLLAANEFVLSAGLETDDDFDKKNWLGEVLYTPWFRNFIRPVATRNAERKEKNKKLPPRKTGWSLKPSFILQAGRSILSSDGIMMNKAKTQELKVPDHDIGRFGLLLEAVWEYQRLTLRLDAELLELFEDEFVAVLDGDDNITLRTVDGLRDFYTVGLDWALDVDKNFVLGVEYQKGEAPPSYKELDTAKTTLTIRY